MGFCALIGRSVTTLTFVATSTGNYVGGTQVAVPGSAQAGDIAVLHDYGSVGSVSVNTPAGWTEINTAAAGGVGTPTCRTSYKILEAGDIGATVTGITASRTAQIMLVLRPDEEIDSVAVEDIASFAAVGNPSDQVVSASGLPTPGVVIGAWAATNPDNLTLASSPAFDDITSINNSGVSGGGSIQLGHKIYSTAPADHTISASGSGARMLQSFYLRVS